jgi:hypothetical protein
MTANHNEVLSGAMVVIIIGVIMAYYIPFWVAVLRGHHAKWGIFIVNTFAGWSGFGWIACLFWAVSDVGQASYRYNRRHD